MTTSRWRAALTASIRSALFLTCSENNAFSFPPTNRQSVDEVIVAYKGTRAGKLRQYIQNKPDKWGFKIFCLGSSSGIIHEFILYQGATTFFNIQEEEHAHLGLEDLLLGANVVSILCSSITHKEETVVFYDNFFTTFNLVKMLHTNLGLRSVPSEQITQVMYFQ